MKALKRLWKRHVRGQPDLYQVYLSVPTGSNQSLMGEIHDRIEELEFVFEGRLDVYARVSRLAVVSDRVPADQFDPTAFDAVLERLEDDYGGTHSVTCLEKWRRFDGQLVKSYVVVPVKPLFPRETVEQPQSLEIPAE